VLVGSSHLLALISAATTIAGEPAPDDETPTDFMWTERGVTSRRFALGEGDAQVRLRFHLLGGAAPSLCKQLADGTTVVRDRYRDLLAGEPPELLVSTLGGNEHSIFSLYEHPVPFDVLAGADDPGVGGDGPPRQIVPLEVVRRELRDRAEGLVRSCAALAALLPTTEVVQVMPPPPIADEAQIRRRPEVFVQVVEQFGVAPAPLRRKIYEIHEATLRDALSGVGVRLLSAPSDACDDGYLAEPYWREATHANTAYGRLVLEQLGLAGQRIGTA